MGRFLFFCLVFFVIVGEARADNGCELRRVLSIESKPDPGRHLLLPVTLMDRDTHLLLDTGGAWSVMDEHFAKSLQLPFRRHTGDVQFFDAVGGRVSSYVRVPAMKVNGIPLKQTFEFLVVNLGGSDRASGTMAMNFFQNMDIELDNAKRTIGLFLQRDCEGGGVHWADESTWFPFRWDGGIPVVRMEIDGKDINAVIDTGSTSTLIDLDFMRRQFGITPESPGVTKLGVATLPSGRTAEIYGYTFKSLTISGVAFQNVPAEIVDLRGGIAQLVLGMNELRFLHLYIATKEKMIYVTAADARRDDAAAMSLSAPTRPRARLSRESGAP